MRRILLFSRFSIYLFPFLLFFISPLPAFADTVNLSATDDSYVRSGQPNQNYGTDDVMNLNDDRDGLVRFDLSTIPAGSTITSATLTLTATSLGGTNATKNYGVHRILTDWDEGTVTWNDPGSTVGTHFSASASDIVTVATAGPQEWDITSDVQAYSLGTATNYGWRVIWESNPQGSSRQADFATKEHATTAYHPVLTVEYTPPSGDGTGGAGPSRPSPNIFPSEILISVLPDRCTTDRNIQLLLHAHNAAEVKISNEPTLSDSEWQPFEPGTDRTQIFNWMLSEDDGEKTVYVVFKGPFFDLTSPVQEVNIELDQETLCQTPSEHAHIVDLEGRLMAAGTDPGCLSDFAHTRIVPYIVDTEGNERGINDFYVRGRRTPDGVTEYSFDTGPDFAYDDVILTLERFEQAVSAHILSINADKIDEIRLRILAEDFGPVADLLLWSAESGGFPEERLIDFTQFDELCESSQVPHPHPGDVFQSPISALYYFGRDFMRHVFPTEDVFKSWFPEGVNILSFPTYKLFDIPLGENVTLKPGSLARIDEEPCLFVVDLAGQLRPLSTRVLSNLFYGVNVIQRVIYEIGVAFFTDYVFGPEVVTMTEFLEICEEAERLTLDDLWPMAAEDHPYSHALRVADGRVVFEGAPYASGETEINFRILSFDGEPFTASDLNVEFERRLHLLLIRDDFREFYHLHPQETDGLWSVDADFPESGIYYAYVDIAPVEGPRVILRSTLAVGEDPEPREARPEPDPALAAFINPFRAEVDIDTLEAGRELPMSISVTKDGLPFSDIQTYLGAYAHVVVLNHENLSAFVHAHPGAPPDEGKINMSVRFPYEGRYTMFVQVNLAGGLYTFPITLDVPAE